jgi:hypothetical protein
MVNDKKTSIIREALTDYNTIKEAAETNAKNKLAEEFPENFNKLLKEEINKNKSAKESYKKLDEVQESDKDETELNKESDMDKKEKETKKVVKEDAAISGKGKPFITKPKAGAHVEEDVKITDTVGKGDPFDEKAKGVKKIEEEREKDFVGDVEAQTPNLGKGGEAEKGKIFDEKIKGPSSGKPISNLKEEFDISELDMSSVGGAIEGAQPEDDIITIDEIENEIANMAELGEDLDNMSGLPRPSSNQGDPLGQEGDPFKQKLLDMRNEIDEMINSIGNVDEPIQKEGMGLQSDEMNPQEFSAVGEQKEFGGKQNYVGRENGGPTTGMIQDEDSEITDDDIDSILGAPKEGDVVEAKGISYSDGSITPGKLGDHDGTHGRFRHQGVEESKKLNGLIGENKKLTKKLNETKKFKESVNTLVESYKSALEKYRNQLKEMAVFNTNLAHVNNLLVNESLALTQDDKIKIINEFKTVDSIAESQKKYKAFLTEMKDSKKTITESIENKVSASIQPSSKQKLDEVTEVTAYANDKHIQRMRSLIEYVEHRGKKIIK